MRSGPLSSDPEKLPLEEKEDIYSHSSEAAVPVLRVVARSDSYQSMHDID
jgi:hypothetical protein